MAAYERARQDRPSKKWLWGCCGGCAGLVLIIMLAVGIGIYLLVRPRPVLPPETFLSPGADAFLVVQISPEHEGLVRMLQEHAKAPPPGLQPAEKMEFITETDQIRRNLARVLPLHVVVTARHLAPEEQHEGRMFAFGGVFSIKGFSGLMRLMFKAIRDSVAEQGGSIEKYEGVEIGVSAAGACLAVLDNNFMFAGDVETIKEWIDRTGRQKQLMKEAAEGAAKPVLPYEGADLLKGIWERLDRNAQLRFASLNSHGEVQALLKSLRESDVTDEKTKEEVTTVLDVLAGTDIASPGVAALGGMGRIAGPDTIEFEFLVDCDEPAFAQHLRDQLVQVLEQRGPEVGLEEVQHTLDGSRIQVTFKAKGLQEALRKAVEQAQRQQP